MATIANKVSEFCVYMKLNINNNVLLTACVILLAVLCFLSVEGPLSFEREQKQREKAVKAQIDKIIKAEQRYCQQKGVYTGSFDVLTAEGLLDKADRYVPYTKEQSFELDASAEVGKSGRSIPQVICGARYAVYLQGLDEDKVNELITRAAAMGSYPGIQVIERR